MYLPTTPTRKYNQQLAHIYKNTLHPLHIKNNQFTTYINNQDPTHYYNQHPTRIYIYMYICVCIYTINPYT